ncbi:hypothetical protein, partial [Klebsiella pneumoniae]
SVRHIFKPISYLEIQLLSGVSGGYINGLLFASVIPEEKWSRVSRRSGEIICCKNVNPSVALSLSETGNARH